MTGEENRRLFSFCSSFRNPAGHLYRRVRNSAGIVWAGEYVTVCEFKLPGGTLGDSGLARARATQKYLARGGL